MSRQFKDQGGAATMDPSPLARRLTSNLASYLNSEKKLIKRRLKAEKVRKKGRAMSLITFIKSKMVTATSRSGT